MHTDTANLLVFMSHLYENVSIQLFVSMTVCRIFHELHVGLMQLLETANFTLSRFCTNTKHPQKVAKSMCIIDQIAFATLSQHLTCLLLV